MNVDRFYDRIIAHGGFRSRREAEDAVKAVLFVLGENLRERDAEALAAEFTVPLARQLIGSDSKSLDADDFYREVGTEEWVNTGYAREHVGVVLQSLAQELPESFLERLRKQLDPEIAEKLRPARASRSEVPPHHGTQSTLAEGRPGSKHPLSEAHPSHTQRDSIAATDNPHEDRKLSSAHPPRTHS